LVRLEHLSKGFRVNGRFMAVLRDVTLEFPTGRSVALMGRNGAGKSTLLSIIAGTTEPDRGRVVSDGTISWPVGFGGSFHSDLTGAQNIRFIARIYGVDTDELCAFVEDFAELGDHFHAPIRSYSSGMRSRLAFGVSMGIRFDTYLVDEVTAVGDAVFRRKSRAVFEERMKSSSAFVVSHEPGQLRQFCNAGCVLDNGRLDYFDDLEAALARHAALMA